MVPLLHKHLIIRAEVDKAPTNANYISSVWMPELIKSINMKILMGPFSTYSEMVGNRGLTAICIIETSHIALHTWDECSPHLLQLDVYTCSSLDPYQVSSMLLEFEPSKIEMKYLDRENNLTEIGI
jgi:S-adenosylmethionine/arginine decarboxylase-like enzyme